MIKQLIFYLVHFKYSFLIKYYRYYKTKVFKKGSEIFNWRFLLEISHNPDLIGQE